MVEVKIESVRMSARNQFRAVVLKDVSANRYLPIYIGQAEADSISIHLAGVHVPRPLTHDLIVNILKALEVNIRYVIVNELREDTYYARIVMRTAEGRDLSIDSRPSDAIAIAVRWGCPIFVDDEVMNQHAVVLEEETGEETEARAAAAEPGASEDDEDLGAFKDFLSSLDLDDLDKPR